MHPSTHSLSELLATLAGIFSFEALLIGAVLWFSRKERARQRDERP